MFRRAYQLWNYINIWITNHSWNEKIEVAKIQFSKWQYMLLMKTLFDKFYEAILIVSRTLNSNVHLRFRIFDAMFNHLQEIENIFQKVVIIIAILFLQFVKLQIKNSTNIIIAFEENAKLYTILSIFWILVKNWNYINIEMKSKSMKMKF